MGKIDREAEAKAYKRFLREGMTPEGACGLIGNLEAESDGFIPSRVEYLCLSRLKEAGKEYTQESYTAAIDGGTIGRNEFLHPLPGKQYGYGLAQWTSPGRKQELWDLAHEKGVSIADLDMQMDYLMSELRGDYRRVLQALQNAGSIREASDIVLKDFEAPADTGAAIREGRAARGTKFFNTIKEVMPMGVRMSNCGHDENNKYTGGAAGDQTGNEWYLREWYSYPWDHIIRWKNRTYGNLFADLAVEAAQNAKIGYDQGQRGTFLAALEAAKWRPANINTACEADCSSGTIALIKAVGWIKGLKELTECSATYTGDMMPWFKSAAGKKYFTILEGRYLTDPSAALRGDINLNDAHHVNITVDNGSASAQQPQTEKQENLIGDCTVTLHTFLQGAEDPQIKAIQTLLKKQGYKGKDGKALTIDGELGENTAYAIEQMQRKNGFDVSTNWGTVAAKTWLTLLTKIK